MRWELQSPPDCNLIWASLNLLRLHPLLIRVIHIWKTSATAPPPRPTNSQETEIKIFPKIIFISRSLYKTGASDTSCTAFPPALCSVVPMQGRILRRHNCHNNCQPEQVSDQWLLCAWCDMKVWLLPIIFIIPSDLMSSDLPPPLPGEAITSPVKPHSASRYQTSEVSDDTQQELLYLFTYLLTYSSHQFPIN